MSTNCRIFVLSNGVDEGVGLCTRHYLHRTDHMKNGKQHTAYQNHFLFEFNFTSKCNVV